MRPLSSAPTATTVTGVHTPLRAWIAQADNALAGLVPVSTDVARAKMQAPCVDGQIIGTGKADFTQCNTTYAVSLHGRAFQLMDVPGIEGHEQRFAHLVSQAIAKAHLVFYVNGTNKKPEATTVKKIQSYLRRGSQVSVLLNVKEYSDAYEFEDDREDLGRHAGAGTALRQTEEVLAAALRPEQLMAGQCVQGLLAFSALAFEPRSGQSTVHPSRSHDLAVHQGRYLQAFGSAATMRRFSRIDEVAAILSAKAQTFLLDIVEANKSKVRELLADTLEVLGATLKVHQDFIARIEPELAGSRAAVDQALESFSQLALGARHRTVDACFNGLDHEAQAIVAEHFGDQDAIRSRLEDAFCSSQDGMVQTLHLELTSLLETLEADLQRAAERLLQNLQRADLELKMIGPAQESRHMLRFDARELNMDLGLGVWGKVMFGVGALAWRGAQFGLAFPPWGAFIGAGIGFIVGAALSILGVFSSQAEKIRRAQRAVQATLDRSHDEALGNATHAHDMLMEVVRAHVDAHVRRELGELQTAFAQPGELVEQQIQQMGRILRQVEDMPRGAVQTIRL